MCNKMTQHWKEKEHWLQRTEGWHSKTELWDGDRFAELSWFWDPASTWTLPVRCTTQGCRNIISSEVVDSLPEVRSGIKEVTCDECHHLFSFQVKSAQGDPRNIALLGHRDGFQPFGSSNRSTGAIEVTIGTMSKFHRMSTEEVYTVGFVPSYLLPDKRPNALGPFLEPLVADLENSFIEGIEVNYKGEIDGFPSGKMTVRLLLILWTGDHPAQCEICKSKGAGGKKGCRRCKKVGAVCTLVPASHYLLTEWQ